MQIRVATLGRSCSVHSAIALLGKTIIQHVEREQHGLPDGQELRPGRVRGGAALGAAEPRQGGGDARPVQRFSRYR